MDLEGLAIVEHLDLWTFLSVLSKLSTWLMATLSLDMLHNDYSSIMKMETELQTAWAMIFSTCRLLTSVVYLREKEL